MNDLTNYMIEDVDDYDEFDDATEGSNCEKGKCANKRKATSKTLTDPRVKETLKNIAKNPKVPHVNLDDLPEGNESADDYDEFDRLVDEAIESMTYYDV